MLVVPVAVRAAVVAHARAGAPREVCGVLGGTYGERVSRVTRHVPVRNVAARPQVRYELDPGEQADAMRDVESPDEAVVGFYHSHPAGPSAPSATDAALATWTDYSYVVVALGGSRARSESASGVQPVASGVQRGSESALATVGAWRWTGERFAREAVVAPREDWRGGRRPNRRGPD